MQCEEEGIHSISCSKWPAYYEAYGTTLVYPLLVNLPHLIICQNYKNEMISIIKIFIHPPNRQLPFVNTVSIPACSFIYIIYLSN